MKDLSVVIYEIRKINELGSQNTGIHCINPAIKIIVTFAYLIKVLSLKQFTFINVAVFLLYPILIFIIGKIPVKSILKKVMVVLPVVFCISAVNLIINFSYEEVMKSIMLMFKCAIALTDSLLLIATTGMNKLSIGLRTLRIPKILVNQIILLYRYIILMIEECYKVKCAYELRTLGKKSMEMKDFGKIMGHLLLKSIDRSENVYASMELRGFKGDLYFKSNERFKVFDFIYLGINLIVLLFI